MIQIQTILIAIFNAYILYNILSMKGPKYAFYFLFIWDMIFTTINLKGQVPDIKSLILIVVYTLISNIIKVYVNNYFYKRVNTVVAFIAISVLLEMFISSLVLSILTTL